MRSAEVRGLKDLFVAAARGGATTIEQMHTSISRRPFEVLERVPVTRLPAGMARWVHDAIAGGIYSGLRGCLQLAGGAAEVALTPLAETEPDPDAPRPSALDLTLGALNGILGHRLEEKQNGLRIQMEFFCAAHPLALQPEALRRAYPEAGSRLAVFVHGLAGTEQVWRFYSEESYGVVGTTYGSLLERELGYSPLYLRYNSGLHVSRNGGLLAERMEELVHAWPTEVREIILVGHSMGGLVARSACHQGREGGKNWVDSVRHIFCLGTPHLGAPLEKLGNVAGWVLNAFDVTKPLASVLNARSDGIKDLRFGYLVEEDWQGRDVDALLEDNRHDIPFLDSAAHYFVAATLTEDPRHPLGVLLGDTLVRFPSAAGRPAHPARRFPFAAQNGLHLGGMTHLRLLNHPAVFDQLRFWLGNASHGIRGLESDPGHA